MGTIRSGLGCLSWLGAILIVIALVLKVLLFDMAELAHNGMAPTLLRGERVLINKRATPELGSIAVCKHPTRPGWVVSRVAATGGMTIDSFGHALQINGESVRFKKRGSMSFHNADTDTTASVIWGDERIDDHPHQIFLEEGGRYRVSNTEVKQGQLYLLNDYRSHWVEDSRTFGPVDASTCRGTIVFRLFPVEGLDREIAHRYFELIR